MFLDWTTYKEISKTDSYDEDILQNIKGYTAINTERSWVIVHVYSAFTFILQFYMYSLTVVRQDWNK